MGRGYTEYAFPDSGSDNVFSLYSAFLNYRLDDNLLLPVRQADCWCYTCQQITIAEQIESIDEMQAELRTLLDPNEEEKLMIAFIVTPIEQRIAELHTRIQWRQRRTAPAKCLHCGQAEIELLPCKDEFPHPVTGERVRVVSRGWAEAGPWEAEFSPDGVRLGTG
ncbi:hypothetical protein NA78x_000313 [Anatilimnocola sp. NA78]|uniref:hypothetical protein n=1 Tax=Anatilimnocola sp. NA78 TaxID=3415683 RepID=UPI003CE47122